MLVSFNLQCCHCSYIHQLKAAHKHLAISVASSGTVVGCHRRAGVHACGRGGDCTINNPYFNHITMP